ncbi:hypothetical protein BD408DRAFT_448847, partial [Parasitella parasitica]
MRFGCGTVVSLTGYFFPSKVRPIERGDDDDEEENTMFDVLTEVYTNGKPYGVRVVIPGRLALNLPDPASPDVDKVYFVHVMGHNFDAAVVDPVRPLEPFGNHARMHVNAFTFDIWRCQLPTDLFSIYASEGGTVSYDEIVNFCHSCRNVNLNEQVNRGQQDNSALSDINDSDQAMESDEKSNENSDYDSDVGEVFRRRRQRTRISSISSSGSSSVKIDSEGSDIEDSRETKKANSKIPATVVLPPININNHHNHYHQNQLTVHNQKSLWQENQHQHNFNANINFQMQNNLNVAVQNNLNVVKNEWNSTQLQYNKFEQNNRLNINNSLNIYRKDRNATIMGRLNDVACLDREAVATIEHQLNTDAVDEAEDPGKTVARIGDNHFGLAKKLTDYATENDKCIREDDKIVIYGIINDLTLELPQQIQDLFDARSQIHSKYEEEVKKFNDSCNDIMRSCNVEIGGLNHHHSQNIATEMTTEVNKLEGQLQEHDRLVEQRHEEYFKEKITKYQDQLRQEFDARDTEENMAVVDRIGEYLAGEAKNIMTSNELTSIAGEGVKSLGKMLRTTKKVNAQYLQQLKLKEKNFAREKEEYERKLKKGKYKAYIDGQNDILRRLKMEELMRKKSLETSLNMASSSLGVNVDASECRDIEGGDLENADVGSDDH